MGFLYLGHIAGEEYACSGNNGMLDIIDGLKWVHENIEAFGGDPSNVMIFGESGGGAKTSCLYAMPDAEPYFHKASIESGPGVMMTPLENAMETTNLLLSELQINKKDWGKLLDLPVSVLLDMQMNGLPRAAAGLRSERLKGIGGARIGGFGPVVDGKYLPQHPFEPDAPIFSKDKPLMIGWSEDEYTFFGMSSGDTEAFMLDSDGLENRLRNQFGDKTGLILDTYRNTRPEASPSDIYVAIQTMLFAGLGSIEIAQKKVLQQAAPAYLYNFGYKSETLIQGTDYPLGTPHAMDIQFKFYNVIPDENGEVMGGFGGNRPERFEASQNFSELWTNFAKNSIPSAEGQPEWSPYNLETRPLMRIDTNCEVINRRYQEEVDMWRSIET